MKFFFLAFCLFTANYLYIEWSEIAMLSSLQHTENATTRPKAVWDIISKLKKWAEAVIIPRLYSKEDYYQAIWMNKLLEHCVKETSWTLVKQRWTATSKKTLRLCRVRFLVSSRRFVSWEATPTAGRMKEFPRAALLLYFSCDIFALYLNHLSTSWTSGRRWCFPVWQHCAR